MSQQPAAKVTPRRAAAKTTAKTAKAPSPAAQKATPGPQKAPAAKRVRVRRESLPEPAPQVRLPGVGWTLPLPAREQVPFIVGLSITVALDLIEWPVAVIVCLGHTLATRSRNEAIRELAGGIESGA